MYDKSQASKCQYCFHIKEPCIQQFFQYSKHVDKPGPPEGPLKPEGITKNSVTLSWNPPLDDGGSEVTNYILEKREADRLSWSAVSRSIHGLKYNVTGLKDGTKYMFRVKAENKYGTSEPLETTEPVLVKSPFGKRKDPIVRTLPF